MDRERETLAVRLKRLRKAKGVSQHGLAVEAGLTAQALYLVEAGKRHFQRDTASRVAQALGVTPEYLLYGYQPATVEGEVPDIEVYLRQTRKLSDADIREIARIVRALEAQQLQEMDDDLDRNEDAV